MAKIEHIALGESFLDFLICPVDEELIVKIGFLGQSTWEINRILEASPIPICFEQDAKFLSPAQRKDWDQNFTTLIEGLVDLPQKLSFTRSFWVSDCRGVCSLSEHNIRP